MRGEGNKVLVFRELNERHLHILEEWFQDDEVLKRLGGLLPIEQWFQYVKGSEDSWAWIVFSEEVPVGNLYLEVLEDSSAYISLLTNPELRNRGYGKKMLKTFLQRPEINKVDKIEVAIETDNIASLACFKHVGFKENGMDEDGLQILTLQLLDK